jgi:hypothetical protein
VAHASRSYSLTYVKAQKGTYDDPKYCMERRGERERERERESRRVRVGGERVGGVSE